MLIPGIDPYLVHLGPIGIRWYGFFMAVSIAIGIVWFVREGRKRGVDEDFLYNVSFLGIVGGVVGARLVYVATNLPYFVAFPGEIVRVDHGGLSIHGALLGGAVALFAYASRHRVPVEPLFDWAVPGVAVGIALVRIGNIFNQEILGHPAEILGGARHPAQLYGSAIGVVLLCAHLLASRRPTPDGYRFWSFFLWYSVLRGVVEESVRDNPLYLVHYVNPVYGVGFMTLTQWATIVLVPFAALMRARALRRKRYWRPEAEPHPA
ncbi:MAG: prolipoprotein diacylglyceryl transferase [Clostridia bacterium]|nr:prolipoprotein diacylglyceryl transferase [Clostridia bacterium]